MTSAGDGNPDSDAAARLSSETSGPLRGTDPQRAGSLSEGSTRTAAQSRSAQSTQPRRSIPASPPPKGHLLTILDCLHEGMRSRRYNRRTEQTHHYWIKLFSLNGVALADLLPQQIRLTQNDESGNV